MFVKNLYKVRIELYIYTVSVIIVQAFILCYTNVKLLVLI